MLEADVRLLSPAKLARVADYLGIHPRGSRGIYFVRKTVTDRTGKPRQLKRSTGTADLRLAVLRASEWWEDHVAAVKGGKLATLENSGRWASLEQIRTHYLRAASCSPLVRKKNFQRLVVIVGEMFPDVEDPLKLGADVLDGRLARLWQLKHKEEAEKQFLPGKPAECERAKRGANCCYRQARSVFSARMMRSYADALLRVPPEAVEFGKQGFIPAAKAPPSEQLRPEVVAKILRLLPKLRTVRPGIWAAFLLMFRGGLRNSEAAKARWDWLAESVDGTWRLALHTQADYKPKAEPRSVALSAGIVAMLKEVRKASEPDKKDADPHLYLVPAESEPRRHHFCNRGVNKFLRACGVRTVKQKVAYRLRGHAITEVMLASGLDAAKEFAGHTSTRTTEIYKGAAVPYAPLAL